MATYLDLENWKRKDPFHLFKKYDNPFFNLCVDVDVTDLIDFTKENDLSFFIASLYLSTKSTNRIEEFRYRIRGEKVIIHDLIHAGSTVLNHDETFSFCYFDYSPEFGKFNEAAAKKLVKHAEGCRDFNPRDDRDDLIHYSVIPWVSFKSFAHAKRFGAEDSIPKIVFGKYYRDGGITKMPVSVEVHHALMDGIHVGKFIDMFQNYLSHPAEHL